MSERSRATVAVQGRPEAGTLANDRPPRLAPVSLSTESVSLAVRAHWGVVAIITIAITLIAWIVAAIQPKRYRANAIAAVVAIAENVDAGDLYRGVEVLEQRTIVATVAALASLPEPTRQATSAIPGAYGHYDITATVLPNTNLVRVDVEGPDAVMTAAIANRVPPILAAQTRSMYKLYSVVIVSAAATPITTVSPRITRIVIAGMILGLLLGAGVAFGIESIRRSRATPVGVVPPP